MNLRTLKTARSGATSCDDKPSHAHSCRDAIRRAVLSPVMSNALYHFGVVHNMGRVSLNDQSTETLGVSGKVVLN